MKKTSRSLMVFALAALWPPFVWSEAAAEFSAADEESSPIPAGAAVSSESPQAPAPLLYSAKQDHRSDAPGAAENQAPPPPPTAAEHPPQAAGGMHRENRASYHSWIEKVRAQRKARAEEHREAMEARRNYLVPSWDHPQYESMEIQREKMREAWHMHNERREQVQREYRRWTNPHGEMMKEMHDARRQLMEAEAEQQRMQADLLWQRQQEWMYGQMPHGWNNPWYYRGY